MFFDRALVSTAVCSTAIFSFTAYKLRKQPRLVNIVLGTIIFGALCIFSFLIQEKLSAVPFLLRERIFDGSEKRFACCSFGTSAYFLLCSSVIWLASQNTAPVFIVNFFT